MIHRNIRYVHTQRLSSHLQCCYTTLRNSKIQKVTEFSRRTWQLICLICCEILCNLPQNYCTNDYRATRTMPSQDVCLFVRLSVCHTPVLSLNGYIYPQSFFLLSGSPTTVVFPYQTGWQYSDGDTPNRGVKCKGYVKIHDFRPISCFVSQMMRDRAIVTMEGE